MLNEYDIPPDWEQRVLEGGGSERIKSHDEHKIFEIGALFREKHPGRWAKIPAHWRDVPARLWARYFGE